MRQIVVDKVRFYELCGSPTEATVGDLHRAAQQSKLCYADDSWIVSARARSGARYLGWFYSPTYQRDVLVINADGTLIR